MLPIPKDDSFQINGKDTWEDDAPSVDYDEDASDGAIVASNPAAFDYSEFDEKDDHAIE
jgi:hypothetical protein